MATTAPEHRWGAATVGIMYAGIETGGTKTVCAVGNEGRIEARAQFPTGTEPHALVDRCARFFAGFDVAAVGLGTFGPCDPDPASATYGHILATPKPGWAGVDLLGLLTTAVAAPIVMTTDVGAAAVGELQFGAGRDVQDLVYLTIGTGIGGGVVSGGRLLHGWQHPEVGHMLLPTTGGPGVCPYHGNCFEGMASGPALEARLGRPATEIDDGDPVWDSEAQIVVAGLHNIVCAVSPQKIIIGGGVGSREGLHRRLPGLLSTSLAGYLRVPDIAAPALGSDAGVIGAMTLAQIQG